MKSDSVSEVLALVKWRAGGDDSDYDGDGTPGMQMVGMRLEYGGSGEMFNSKDKTNVSCLQTLKTWGGIPLKNTEAETSG